VVSAGFGRIVPDGVLNTGVVMRGAYGRGEGAFLSVSLVRDRNDYVRITSLEFGPDTEHVSPKTVRFVRGWVRTKARPWFLKAKEARDAVCDARASMENHLRDTYKP
jgi:hypothetical protein